MYKISKEFHFSAAHQLFGLPSNHPCSRLHGHNYIFIFELEGEELNEVGFIKDYREFDFIKNYIDNTLDHQDLNKVFSFQPSAENMAREMYLMFKPQLKELSRVYVKETEKTIASYGK